MIDGTTYRYSYRFNDDNDGKLDTAFVDQTVSFYLDKQGNIIRFEDTSASLDYAFVYSVGVANSQFNDSDKDFGAKLVLTDGSVKTVILDGDTADKADSNNNGTDITEVKAYWENKIVSYSQNDDSTYTLGDRTTNALTAYGAAKDDVVKNGNARVVLSNGSSYVYADKNTVFLINDSSDDGDDFNAYVGYSAVPNVDAIKGATTTKIATYVKGSTGVAKVIVLSDTNVSGSAKDVIFVVGKNQATIQVNKTGSTEYYVYDAVVNGEVTTIKVKADSDAQDLLAGIAKNAMGVYFGITENSGGFVTKLNSKTPSDVAVNGATNASNGGINVSFTEYTGTKRESNGGNLTFDTAGSKISLAANSDAVIAYYDGTDLSITTRIKTDGDDKAIVVTDDGEVIAICVREFGNGTLGG